MVQYYTLEEAARLLHTSQDEVKKLAEDKKVRAFRDRGTLRFRAQDIDELARSLGLGSDPDLPLGEVPAPKKGGTPTPRKAPQKDDVFEFDLGLDDSVEIGQELSSGPGGSKPGSKPGSGSKIGGKSGSGRHRGGPPSPPPRAGSDSDVRLVQEGSDLDFQVEQSPSKSPAPGPKTPGSGRKKPSKLIPDSGVQMVPLDAGDSDIRMAPEPDDAVPLGRGQSKSASDSDIRLEHSKPGGKRPSDDALVTDEIDLDAELARGPKSPGRRKGAQPPLPTSSPFELSEADAGPKTPRTPPKSGRPAKATQHKPPTDSSSDIELKPAAASPLELGSDEMPAAPAEDEEVKLGELAPAGSGDSGINLRDPADSGISLEHESSDEVEFELSLDAGATPKPAPGPAADSDSEFELSLDDSSETEAASASADSSEFELSLDADSSEVGVGDKAPDSDSEFELTLDDSGGSSPLDESSGERDIFETDFEVPALDEESGSEAVALDEDATDLESDFDLALGDEDAAAEDESGSQVVALEDEEEADEGASTVARQTRAGGRAARLLAEAEEEEESDFAGIGPALDEDEEAVAAGEARVEYRDTPPAPWGPLPVILMVPCVLVLFLVGVMGYELLQGMTAYHKGDKATGMVTSQLVDAVGLGPLPGAKKK